MEERGSGESEGRRRGVDREIEEGGEVRVICDKKECVLGVGLGAL